MPRSGTGTYNLPATNPVVTGTQITTAWANPTMADIAAELTNSLPRDGQAPPTNNLPMGGFKLINLGSGSARTDAVNLGQLADGSLQYLTGVSGSDTITAVLTPAPTNYVAGQVFNFVAAGTSSSAPTLNINGLGAKPILSGTSPASLFSGIGVQVLYDGTNFQVISGSQIAGQVALQDSPDYWIATNLEALASEIGSNLRKWVTVTDPRFGGAVSGSWHVATQNAGAYAAANGLHVRFLPQPGGYPFTGVAQIPAGVCVDMTGSGGITYSGSRPAIPLTIGTNTVYNRACHRGIEVNMASISWSGNTTTTYDDVCLRLINPVEADIHINRVSGATIGYELYADAPQNISYNTIRVDKIADCMLHEVLRTYNSAVINNNLFLGGSCSNSSSSNALGTGYGTVLTWNKTTGARGQNGNTWVGRSYELGTAATRIPVFHDGAGGYNRWISSRHESNNGPFAYCDGGGVGNVIHNVYEIGYSPDAGLPLPSITNINGAFGNIYQPTKQGARVSNTWCSGEIASFVSGQIANTPYISGPLHLVQNSAAVVKSLSSGNIETGIENGIEYFRVSSTNGVGVFFDTSVTKDFFITEYAIPGFSGRILVQCFDSTGAILTSAGANHPYVRSGANLSYSSNYGGQYMTTSDGFKAENFTFHADVQYVRLMFVAGTNPLKLISFSIAALGVAPTGSPISVFVGGGLNDDGTQKVSTAKPDTAGEHGRYARGNEVGNSGSTAGQPAGWTCSLGGRLAKQWVTATTINYGQIRKNGANVYASVTAGAVATGATAPTHTSGTASDGAVTWLFISPLATFATQANLV